MARQHGWLSQSFGLLSHRALVVVKPELVGGPPSDPCPRDGYTTPFSEVLFSAVRLDSGSSRALLAALQSEIPPRWQVHSDHMTICMGPLSLGVRELRRKHAASVAGEGGQ
eukprot:RCo037048